MPDGVQAFPKFACNVHVVIWSMAGGTSTRKRKQTVYIINDTRFSEAAPDSWLSR